MRTAVSSLTLLQPRNVAEALRMLRDEGPLVPLAGCTDVYVGLNFGTLPAKKFLSIWLCVAQVNFLLFPRFVNGHRDLTAERPDKGSDPQSTQEDRHYQKIHDQLKALHILQHGTDGGSE